MEHKYFVVQLLDNFNSMINARRYNVHERLLVYKNDGRFIITNTFFDYLPIDLCKILYKVSFEEV